MQGFYRLLLKKGDPHDIIPFDSYWAFRWGYQGIRAVLSFRVRERVIDQGFFHGSKEFDRVNELLAADRFACRYGRLGKSHLRSVVKYAEDKEIARREELRSLIQHGDMREKGGCINVKSSSIWLILAVIYLLICFVGVAGMVFLILSAPIPILNQLIGLGIYLGLFLGCGYAMYDAVFHPFYLAKKLGTKLESVDMSPPNQPKFTIV